MNLTSRTGQHRSVSWRLSLFGGILLLACTMAGAIAASAASSCSPTYSLTDLGTLGGDYSQAYAINASGQVVGHAFPASGGAHAFLYDGTTLRDLGTLGGNHSDAMAINAGGQVVGKAETPSGGPHAFLYDGTTMHDLNNLLDASGDGWTVVEARAINDAGQIAATAHNPDAVSHAVLLTPRITVSIKIRPRSSPGPINPKSHGKIPVAILSATTFDASTQIDRSSLTFGRVGDEPSLAFCSHTPKDVNGDGLPDLLCHFYTWAAGFQNRNRQGITQGVLKGRTVSGTSFIGSDSIRVVPAERWLHSLRRNWQP